MSIFDFTRQLNHLYGEGNINYHEFSISAQIWKLTPYITYNYFSDAENIIDIGVSFTF